MIRKIPWGYFSILLFIFGILYSVKVGRTFCLGNIVFKAVGIPVYSKIHNTLFVSLLLFAGGYVLSKVFSKNEGAVLGKNLNLIFGATVLIIIVCIYLFKVDLLYPLYKLPGT